MTIRVTNRLPPEAASIRVTKSCGRPVAPSTATTMPTTEIAISRRPKVSPAWASASTMMRGRLRTSGLKKLRGTMEKNAVIPAPAADRPCSKAATTTPIGITTMTRLT